MKGELMASCNAASLFDEMSRLLKKADPNGASPPSPAEWQRLRELIDEWWKNECPEDNCQPGCIFGRSEGWIANLGYEDWFDLINENLDAPPPGAPLAIPPRKPGGDIMNHRAKRRPGHYKP